MSRPKVPHCKECRHLKTEMPFILVIVLVMVVGIAKVNTDTYIAVNSE